MGILKAFKLQARLMSIATTSFHAKSDQELRSRVKLLGKLVREIPPPKTNRTWVHPSVKERYAGGYRSEPIEQYNKLHGQWPPLWPG